MKPAMNGGSVQPGNSLVHQGDCHCPTCDSPITMDRLAEIQGKQRTHDAEIERAAEARFAAKEATIRKEAIATANAALAAKLTEAAQARKALEQQIKALKSSTKTVIAARLEAQRIQFESKTTEAVNVERARMFGEKLKLEEQLQDMQRRLQAKTAHQLGEPAEVDLFEALETAFPHDRISRVVKGVKGPDVIVDVVHNGAVVGKIILDSKNHARWSNKFTSKLRSDQLVEGADFAILSTSVFPSGSQQLHLQDNVIVATPARVPVLVHLLRRQIVENHRLKLTAEARDEKAEKLLAYITSPGCTDLMEKIGKLTSDMADLDLKETSAHQTVWKKRGELIRGVQIIHEEFSTAVSAIIAGEMS